MAKLSEEQIEKLGEDYRRMLEQARAQLVEHKMYLIDHLTHHPEMSHQQALVLMEQVTHINLDFVTVEAGIKAHDGTEAKPTISVVWEYPDELVAYLASPNCPSYLAASLKGGIVLQDKQRVE